MSWMALGTLDVRMFCLLFLQHVVYVAVTAGTDQGCRVLTIRNLGGFMNRMATHTIFHAEFHLGAMRFMAGAAFRDVSMLFSVTV